MIETIGGVVYNEDSEDYLYNGKVEFKMSKAVWNFSYKLKKNVTEDEFIESTKKLHDEIISKAKGFVSWEHYRQGDTWTDFVVWETLEDANNGTTVGEGNELTKNFYAKIQMNTCKALISSFVKKY